MTGRLVLSCGQQAAYGYRRIAWWLRRKEGLAVNRKRGLRVMSGRGLLVGHAVYVLFRRKRMGDAWNRAVRNQIWPADITKV